MALSIPVFESLHGYRRAWLRPDVIAGLTVLVGADNGRYIALTAAVAIATGLLAGLIRPVAQFGDALGSAEHGDVPIPSHPTVAAAALSGS